MPVACVAQLGCGQRKSRLNIANEFVRGCYCVPTGEPLSIAQTIQKVHVPNLGEVGALALAPVLAATRTGVQPLGCASHLASIALGPATHLARSQARGVPSIRNASAKLCSLYYLLLLRH